MEQLCFKKGGVFFFTVLPFFAVINDIISSLHFLVKTNETQLKVRHKFFIRACIETKSGWNVHCERQG